jgi:hypothetical protein
MIPIFTIIYIVLGIGFGAIMESSGKPDIVAENRLVRGIFIIVIMLIWLPYLIINACFTKRDIWFRNNDR